MITSSKLLHLLDDTLKMFWSTGLTVEGVFECDVFQIWKLLRMVFNLMYQMACSVLQVVPSRKKGCRASKVD